MTATLDRSTSTGPKPIISGQRGFGVQATVYFGVIAPLLALLAAKCSAFLPSALLSVGFPSV